MKRYFILLNIFLLTLLIYFGVNASYGLLTAQLSENPMAAPVTNGSASADTEIRHPISYYKPITDRNLFKTNEESEKKEAAPPSPPVDTKPAEETTMKLKLWGTVSGADRSKNYAVIEEKGKKGGEQNLYHEGDNIQNATVEEIQREKVILLVDGRREYLKMEDNPDKRSRAAAPPRMPGMTPTATTAVSDARKITLDREHVEEATSNLGKLMRQAKIRPHFKDGKPDGLTLTRVRPNSLFTELGLRSGDIITGVNGKQIESVDDAMGFYKNLKSSPEVSLEIKRRGKTETINYNIE